MAAVLDGRDGLRSTTPPTAYDTSEGEAQVTVSLYGLPLSPPPGRGRIFLVGSSPGHPFLLTLATHADLAKRAQLVLSDKLIPNALLTPITSKVGVRIARKFSGNASVAQRELMEAAVETARRGLAVVQASCFSHLNVYLGLTDCTTRLKQTDSTAYGRASEEVFQLRSYEFEPGVVTKVRSVLAGPTFAGVAVTQRIATKSFVVCTGVRFVAYAEADKTTI